MTLAQWKIWFNKQTKSNQTKIVRRLRNVKINSRVKNKTFKKTLAARLKYVDGKTHRTKRQSKESSHLFAIGVIGALAFLMAKR